jgi:guanylate kinase
MSLLITGGSGSGKSTLAEHMRGSGSTQLPYHTTRAVRNGDIPGIDIVHVDHQQFVREFRGGNT